MKHIDYVCDVESDGQIPGLFNMISFGIVNVKTKEGFYRLIQPDVDNNGGIKEARDVSGISWYQQQEEGQSIETAMEEFKAWLNHNAGKESRKVFWSDNNGFDWQWMNYYLHKYTGQNPFGHSSRRIGDYYAGLMGDKTQQSKWKKLRKTVHSHNALDDALGNAEALEIILKMAKQ